MDFLKAEIQSKKRQLEELSSTPTTTTDSTTTTNEEPPVKRYLKRSELEAMRLQSEREKLAEKERLRKEKLYGKKSSSSSTTTTVADLSQGTSIALQEVGETFNVSNEEAIKRLRRIGQPIRLFAESDKERRLRLRALELIEERTEGQRNDFARAMEGQELGIEREKESNKNNQEKKENKQMKKKDNESNTSSTTTTTTTKSEDKEPKPKDEEVLVDLDLVKTNPHKVYPQIYHALKVSNFHSHSPDP
jgi:pre-mRNA-splicing factor 18